MIEMHILWFVITLFMRTTVSFYFFIVFLFIFFTEYKFLQMGGTDLFILLICLESA